MCGGLVFDLTLMTQTFCCRSASSWNMLLLVCWRYRRNALKLHVTAMLSVSRRTASSLWPHKNLHLFKMNNHDRQSCVRARSELRLISCCRSAETARAPSTRHH